MCAANLKIYFCTYFGKINDTDRLLFDRFRIDDTTFPINGKILETKIRFNEYEKLLGIKVCTYELIKKEENEEELKISGLIELYLGNNVGYCFVDNKGSSMELSFLFLKDKNSLKKFLNNKIIHYSKNKYMLNSLNNIELIPNEIDTEDRANLLLINCGKESILEISKYNKIDLEIVMEKIQNYSDKYSYQICFNSQNYKDFSYKKIENINQLNFDKIYNENVDKINNIYDELFKIIQNNDCNSQTLILDLYKKNNNLKKIIERKYVYPTSILEKEINKNEYIDFFFKLIFFFCVSKFVYHIKENGEKIKAAQLNELKNKLFNNRDKICKDETLKIYEKIFLLFELYFSEVNSSKIYNEIEYINLKNIEDFSPLYYAINFLNKFIDDLDYNSNFYYPLLLIDSGIYNYTYENELDSRKDYLSTHGFNMLSRLLIKAHLKDLLPNIIVLSKCLKNDDYAFTNSYSGLITINLNNFGGINITKKQIDDFRSKHYGFILVKIFVHELFGHKKSCLAKNDKTFESSICFQDESGNLLFLAEKNDNSILFKNIKEIISTYKDFNEYNGDSGYMMEYFFGKIGSNHTKNIMDYLEDKVNLGSLLEPNLWHKDIDTFKKYIELNYYVDKYYKDKITINENLSVKEQITLIENKINKLENENDENKSEGKSLIGFKRLKEQKTLNEENNEFSMENQKIKKRQKNEDFFNFNFDTGNDNYTIDPNTKKRYKNNNTWKYPYRK